MNELMNEWAMNKMNGWIQNHRPYNSIPLQTAPQWINERWMGEWMNGFMNLFINCKILHYSTFSPPVLGLLHRRPRRCHRYPGSLSSMRPWAEPGRGGRKRRFHDEALTSAQAKDAQVTRWLGNRSDSPLGKDSRRRRRGKRKKKNSKGE